MPDFKELLRSDTDDASLLVLFIPSADRRGRPLGKKVQTRWVRKALKMLGENFSGGTAFPRGWGVWRDDARGGRLVWDKPVIIQCFTSDAVVRERSTSLRQFMIELGTRTKQGAVACVLDKTMYQIRFPLEGE
jgi:hypothetical protein